MNDQRAAWPAKLSDVTADLAGFDPASVPVKQVGEIIGSLIEPLVAIEKLALRDSLSRVLAADVLSPIDVPAHDNSAMDGYAVHGAGLQPDGSGRFEIVGTALAGSPFDGTVDQAQAVRIMTGAKMPGATDTVVTQELAQLSGQTLDVPPGQSAGQHRRCRGEDLARGRPALRAGRIISPADLGLLASIGVPEVAVRRRPRVAFFSTGDELRSIGEQLEPGQIYDSNRYTIHGMLRRLGVELIDMGVIPDRPEALEQAMREAGACADAIISSGGVSVGEADYTRSVMAKLGDVAFWTIAMRPGRPMAFGRVGQAWYFGLPGNPVAVMVTFYFFARPALLRLAGAQPQALPYLRARSMQPIRKRPGRTEYQRGILSLADDAMMQVELTGSQGSGVLRSMSEANCMVVLHHDQSSVAAGEPVDCLAFEGLI